MKKKLVIIDGSSLLYRAFFAPAADYDIAGRDAYQCHIRIPAHAFGPLPGSGPGVHGRHL